MYRVHFTRLRSVRAFAAASLLTFCFLSGRSGPDAAVDLVTTPTRDSVQLTIYNSADITMVRETRRLTFKKGVNRIQFAWSGTLIDPTSLRLSFKTRKDGLELLDTVYPPGRRDVLQWNIRSDFDGSARVELNYFTSGITWKADYVLLTNQRENKTDLKGFVRVINKSGEDYPNAKVRLVVGKINLVERIKDLARRGMTYRKLKPRQRRYMRDEFKRRVRRAEIAKSTSGSNAIRRKHIVKEGLSEYFLFSIEGRETIPNGWRKQLRSLYVENVPLNVIYRLSDRRTRGRVHKYYEFKNKKVKGKRGEGQLGGSPLPDGRVQIFSMAPNKDLSFRAAVNMKYIARGDKVVLDTGVNRDVRVRRVLRDYRRTDLTYDTTYRRRVYIKNYREHFFYRTVLENTLKHPVKLEVERSFNGTYKIEKSDFRVRKIDFRTFRWYPELKGDSKKTLDYHISVFRGRK